MTGQAPLDSHADTGAATSVALVNALALAPGAGGSITTNDGLAAIAEILAVDPPSMAQLGDGDVAGFGALAHRLHDVFADLHAGDIDAAARRLNDMLADHPAHPHLAKEHGCWRLHHHPVEAELVPMWTSICAESLARMIGTGYGDRLGTCERTDCGQVFVDISRNASRRFCSTTCQNRVKAAAFRLRRVAAGHG